MNGLIREENSDGELEFAKLTKIDNDYVPIKLDTLSIKIDLPTSTSIETSQTNEEQ